MKVECLPSEHPSLLTIFIDDEPWLNIHSSLFGRRPSLPRECIALEDFAEKFAAAEYRVAKQYAIKRLSMMSLPSSKLIQNFNRFLVSKKTVERLIDELKQLGYLNDAEWIHNFAKSQTERKLGPKAIALKLKNKGLKEDQIKDSLKNLQTIDQQRQSIALLLRQRYKNRDLSIYRVRNQVIGALIRRGFDLSIILDVLKVDDNSID